jgi:hypothetical protein
MAKHSDHGIILDDKSQEQPKDKERAQTVTKTKPGHMPPQPITKKGNKRPSRKKSPSRAYGMLRLVEVGPHMSSINRAQARKTLGRGFLWNYLLLDMLND